MEDEKLLGLLGQGGLGAMLILIIYRIGTRFLDAMDRLVEKIDVHHKADVEHHAEMRESVTALRERVNTIVERNDHFTPVPYKLNR